MFTRSLLSALMLLTACSGDQPVDSVEAARIAKRALLEKHPDAYSAERWLHLEHEVTLKDGKWTVYFRPPERGGCGGDALVIVDRRSGQVSEIGLGQ